jgi:hypothetical protein
MLTTHDSCLLINMLCPLGRDRANTEQPTIVTTITLRRIIDRASQHSHPFKTGGRHRAGLGRWAPRGEPHSVHALAPPWSRSSRPAGAARSASSCIAHGRRSDRAPAVVDDRHRRGAALSIGGGDLVECKLRGGIASWLPTRKGQPPGQNSLLGSQSQLLVVGF